MFYKEQAQCDLLFKSLQISKLNFLAKKSSYNTSTLSLEDLFLENQAFG